MNSLVFKIVYDSTTTVLDHAPDGWDDGLLNLSRQKMSSALFRSYSVKLGFVKEGAQQLRSIFYNDKIDAVALLEIWKLNRISLEYEQKYVGAFDFSTFTDEDYKVSITVVDNSLSALIKAHGKTKFLLDDYIGMIKYIEYPIGIDTYTRSMVSFSDVFTMLLDQVTFGGVTAGDYDIDTTELDNTPFFLTNGGAINETGLRIKTTLNDFLQTVYAISGLSLDLQVVGGVETASFVYDSEIYDNNVEPYHIGNISNFKLSCDTDRLFSSLNIGYDQESDMVYGYNEVNGETDFGVELKHSSTKVEILSKYRSDFNGIVEITSREEIDTGDNDKLFVIVAEETAVPGTYEFEPGTISITNILGYEEYFSFFNSRITPKRLMMLHSDFLSSCIDFENYEANYFSNTYNWLVFQHVKTKFNASPWPSFTNEFEGIQFTAPVFFKPYIFEFEAYVDDDFFETMVGDTSQYLSFDYRGNTFTGFLIDTKIKLHGKSKVKIKMISSADNDLTNLINLANNPVNDIEYDLDFSDANNANLTTLIT